MRIPTPGSRREDPARGLDPGHLRHPEVHQDDVGRRRRRERRPPRSRSSPRRRGRGPASLDERPEPVPIDRVIVDDRGRGCGRSCRLLSFPGRRRSSTRPSGSRARTIVPPPGLGQRGRPRRRPPPPARRSIAGRPRRPSGSMPAPVVGDLDDQRRRDRRPARRCNAAPRRGGRCSSLPRSRSGRRRPRPRPAGPAEIRCASRRTTSRPDRRQRGDLLARSPRRGRARRGAADGARARARGLGERAADVDRISSSSGATRPDPSPPGRGRRSTLSPAAASVGPSPSCRSRRSRRRSSSRAATIRPRLRASRSTWKSRSRITASGRARSARAGRAGRPCSAEPAGGRTARSAASAGPSVAVAATASAMAIKRTCRRRGLARPAVADHGRREDHDEHPDAIRALERRRAGRSSRGRTPPARRATTRPTRGRQSAPHRWRGMADATGRASRLRTG